MAEHWLSLYNTEAEWMADLRNQENNAHRYFASVLKGGPDVANGQATMLHENGMPLAAWLVSIMSKQLGMLCRDDEIREMLGERFAEDLQSFSLSIAVANDTVEELIRHLGRIFDGMRPSMTNQNFIFDEIHLHKDGE